LRVGIATGLVVVGDLIGQGAAQEQAVIGETPNLAARLQALAEPGTVVIAPSTRRLTGEDHQKCYRRHAGEVIIDQVIKPAGMSSRGHAGAR
jgi:class 3 adenylate cyclase